MNVSNSDLNDIEIEVNDDYILNYVKENFNLIDIFDEDIIENFVKENYSLFELYNKEEIEEWLEDEGYMMVSIKEITKDE